MAPRPITAGELWLALCYLPPDYPVYVGESELEVTGAGLLPTGGWGVKLDADDPEEENSLNDIAGLVWEFHAEYFEPRDGVAPAPPLPIVEAMQKLLEKITELTGEYDDGIPF